jgi:hypothetical protein
MLSEREEHMLKQIEEKDARIHELETLFADTQEVMQQLQFAVDEMVAAWNLQQLRIGILESYVKEKQS